MAAHHTDTWPAPQATKPVDADIRVPGSKSLTNRALILAALSAGPSTVSRPLAARDTLLMADALEAMGTRIERSDESWRIEPGPLSGPADVDCGLAGTVMRFVPPVAALADGPIVFDGDPYSRKRPMGPLLGALRALGAHLDDEGRNALPFVVRGTGALRGGTVELDASTSSQYISALLLAGARFDDGVTVHHVGKPVPSLPHVAMTVAMLRERGVTVDDGEPNTWRVEPGPIPPMDVAIEPDLSNAAPFLAAALVTGGRVRLLGWPERTTQPAGELLPEICTRLGGHVRLDDEGLTVRGPAGGELAGVDLDLHTAGELTPVVAAVCALAQEPSYLRNVAHIRRHETDRLAGLASELTGLGGDVTETEDGLEIRPARLHGGTFHTYADHRMAQAGALIGLVTGGVEVEDIATTFKTLPDFVGLWEGLLP